ncbi:MAG: DUF5119 domain-containing protein [Muribaculaceae bacterium]|nr:DUF5119 domain-containing protein [Muribaculaceae bacterium]
MRIALLTSMLLMLLTMAAGCDHIELEERPASLRVPVKIVFDWEAAPEAAPKEMTVYFYRMSERGMTRNPLRYVYELRGSTGGTIMIPSGYYCAVCHNSDTDCHGLTGHDTYEDFGIRLSDLTSASPTHFTRPLKVPGAEDERLAWSADYMWVSAVEGFTVRASADAAAEPLTLVFEMLPVTHHYTFIVHHPSNLTLSTRLNASVSGMSGTVHPARGVTGEETVTHSFLMEANDRGELEGHLLTFGHCGNRPLSTRADEEPAEGLHILALSNDRGWSHTHDVTSHIHDYHSSPGISDPENIVVELDSLTLPPPLLQGGGAAVGVGGWTGTDEILGR